MTTEPDTWDAAAAELGFSDEKPVMKVASDEPGETGTFQIQIALSCTNTLHIL